MRPNTKSHLTDIFSACEELVAIVNNNPDAIESRIEALAMERLLEIVGEALVRIRDSEPTVLQGIPDWEEIVGLRNAIIHGYDKISPLRIREAIREDVPVLLNLVTDLLS